MLSIVMVVFFLSLSVDRQRFVSGVADVGVSLSANKAPLESLSCQMVCENWSLCASAPIA